MIDLFLVRINASHYCWSVKYRGDLFLIQRRHFICKGSWVLKANIFISYPSEVSIEIQIKLFNGNVAAIFSCYGEGHIVFENCVRVNSIGQVQNGGHYFDVFNGLTSSFRTPGKPYVTMQCRCKRQRLFCVSQ